MGLASSRLQALTHPTTSSAWSTKPAAKDTAMIDLHIEPSYISVPFSKLLDPAAPQVNGFVTAVYAAGAGTKANGDYGIATYPWNLAAKTNAEDFSSGAPVHPDGQLHMRLRHRHGPSRHAPHASMSSPCLTAGF
ncbi:hypothetical protein WJX81_000270 [Elliptochloris bilobata]|uniref:Uncharacterized protein n=1 Tax=Elliptochloris bilobata TaxID=381761 RepID=A0AAW1REG1_9CHLO